MAGRPYRTAPPHTFKTTIPIPPGGSVAEGSCRKCSPGTSGTSGLFACCDSHHAYNLEDCMEVPEVPDLANL